MKIFCRESKINFVDDNNVFVGFDYERGCCEQFDASIRELPKLNANIVCGIETKDGCEEYPGFNFDTSYSCVPNDENDELECGGSVAFRLTNGQEEIFLVLKNAHNGYYSHGFDMTKDKTTLFSGYI